MRACLDCRYGEGHASGCPSAEPENKRKRIVFKLGWMTGRSGEEIDYEDPKTPFGTPYARFGDLLATWKLGWCQGTVALEEAVNGDPGYDE